MVIRTIHKRNLYNVNNHGRVIIYSEGDQLLSKQVATGFKKTASRSGMKLQDYGSVAKEKLKANEADTGLNLSAFKDVLPENLDLTALPWDIYEPSVVEFDEGSIQPIENETSFDYVKRVEALGLIIIS